MTRRYWLGGWALLVLTVCVALALGLVLGGGQRKAEPSVQRPRGTQGTVRPPRPTAAEASLLSWRLAAPLSREVVVPAEGSRGLVILGGLTSGAASTDGVDRLDTRDGGLAPLQPLAQATHDAAGAAIGRRILVVGGGTVVPTGTTQIESAAGTVVGEAPAQARADASAVRVGNTVYVVGGYDGAAMDSQVISTADGRSYRTVGVLPVPVRYAALAASGSRIYVFGGIRANTQPSNAVQMIETTTGKARVVGRLPVPLAGAAAGMLDGTVYLAGGRTVSGPTRAIYAFESAHTRFLRVGTLPVAVANAGSSVREGRLWIVGGETDDGRPTAAVQVVVPHRK